LATVATILLLAVLIGQLSGRDRATYKRGCAAIRRMEGRLNAATTAEEVRRWLREPDFADLREAPGLAPRPGEMAVASPGCCCAKNWVLHLRFDGHSLIFSRVGTVDSLDEHPDGAPMARTYELPRTGS
jgi:hypothetical protein